MEELKHVVVVRIRGNLPPWVSAEEIRVAKGGKETVEWRCEKSQKQFTVTFHAESPFKPTDWGNLTLNSVDGKIGPLELKPNALVAEHSYDVSRQEGGPALDPKIVVEEPPPGDRGNG